MCVSTNDLAQHAMNLAIIGCRQVKLLCKVEEISGLEIAFYCKC